MSSACAQIGAWGQVNKMEEVDGGVGDVSIGHTMALSLLMAYLIEVPGYGDMVDGVAGDVNDDRSMTSNL